MPVRVSACHSVRYNSAVPGDPPESAPPSAPSKLAGHFAARLRELRARHGWTQEQVARQLGCHESAVSRWEGGSRFPTGVDLIALADLFGVSADDLLGRGRQHARAGAALVDMQLLQRLASAASTEEFERLVRANQDQAVWLPVPDGAVLMPVTEAMRLAREVAERFSDSSLVDRLFRPRG